MDVYSLSPLSSNLVSKIRGLGNIWGPVCPHPHPSTVHYLQIRRYRENQRIIWYDINCILVFCRLMVLSLIVSAV